MSRQDLDEEEEAEEDGEGEITMEEVAGIEDKTGDSDAKCPRKSIQNT